MFSSKSLMDECIHFFWERPRGLDFSRCSYPYKQGSDYIWYERTNRRHIGRMFSHFKDKKDWPVLDIGCGKGYLLQRVHTLGFETVHGLEHNREIAEIARHNMRQLKLDHRIYIHHGSAEDFEHYHRYNILYMFHPFKTPVMRRVVAAIEQSLRHTPRPLHIIYYYPVEHRLLDRSPFFERVYSETLLLWGNEMNVYYYAHDPTKKHKKNPSFTELLHKRLGQ